MRNASQKKSRYWRAALITAAVTVLLNIILAIRPAADFYRRHIFWLWPETYSRITGLFPFSVGGAMIAAALFLAAAFIVSLVLLLFLKKKHRYVSFIKKFSKSLLAVALAAAVLYTLNCTALFHCSRMDASQEYGAEELAALREYMIGQIRDCGEFDKDSSGASVYTGGDLLQEVKDGMRNISGMFPELSGYYPDVKPFLDSDVMYYGHFTGMYYPFSMEANVSKYLSDTFFPNTAAHELAHLKGFLYENEANFISYLACTGSGNAFVRYSGYLGVIGYVDQDYYNALCAEYGEQEAERQYVPLHSRIGSLGADMYCYKDSEELRALKDREEGVASAVFNTVEDSLMQEAYSLYGNKVNYDEVTLLLLKYYDGKLY